MGTMQLVHLAFPTDTGAWQHQATSSCMGTQQPVGPGQVIKETREHATRPCLVSLGTRLSQQVGWSHEQEPPHRRASAPHALGTQPQPQRCRPGA